MFDHKEFRKYSIDEIPLDRDLFLMNEKWINDYEQAILKGISGGDWEYPGYISYAAALRTSSQGIELAWYPNLNDRFHEIRIFLPNEQFIICVDLYDYDEKPHIFVKNEWILDLYLRNYSVFAMVDAIGVKDALKSGKISNQKLRDLQKRIDNISRNYADLAFISFADSLLIKSNWSVGHVESKRVYTYDPERILLSLPEIRNVYEEILNLPIYVVITQGRNEYYDDELLHISPSGNHISLNSLGLPFAQIQSIESAARKSIKKKIHVPFELYLNENFLFSLKCNFSFDKHKLPKYSYSSPISDHDFNYITTSLSEILENLEL